MSPATTRRTACQGAEAQYAAPEPSDNDDDAGSSSSEDDDGIPAISPHKRAANARTNEPTLSLRPSSTNKRHIEGEASHQERNAKRQKPGENERAGALRQPSNASYPTPDSARSAKGAPATDKASSVGSILNSIEDDDYHAVAPGVLDMVNGMVSATVRHSSPGQQLRREEAYIDDDEDRVVSDLDIDAGYESEDQGEDEESEVVEGSRSPELDDRDLGVGPFSDEVTQQIHHEAAQNQEYDRLARMDQGNISLAQKNTGETPTDSADPRGHGDHTRQSAELPPIDPYEIPDSPSEGDSNHISSESSNLGRLRSPDSAVQTAIRRDQSDSIEEEVKSGRTPGQSNARVNREEVDDFEDPALPPLSQLRAQLHIRDTQPQGSRTIAVSDLELEVDRANKRTILRKGPKLHSRTTSDHTPEDVGVSEFTAEVVLSSDDNEDDDVGGIKRQFAEDLRAFRAKQVVLDDDSAFVDAPLTAPSATISLPDNKLRSACNLMTRLGWSAISKDWEEKLTLSYRPGTAAARQLVHYLKKFERFCVMVSLATGISGKNKFVGEHQDLLKYLFTKIDACIDLIRSEQLSFAPSTRSRQPDPETRKDITRDLIRLVIPLLIRVLGEAWAVGGDELSFTECTLQLLSKLVGWTRKLYAPLMREIQIRPFVEQAPNRQRRSIQGKIDQESRNALGPILDQLHELLKEAPSCLQQVEEDEAELERLRQHSLLKAAKLKAAREREAAREEEAKRLQNLNVVRAIRGEPRLPPTRTIQPMQWRHEEEVCLCNKLKEAFNYDPPRLPDLTLIAAMVGHGRPDTKAKAGDLLTQMLRTVYPHRSRRDIQSQVDGLIRRWA
ncbi:hypothetical protein JX265_001126 [Neoarthrinium moseri]|uniref:Uncharacterized protein n=1 Tax=Neoarthrinium moseri TaxID=1658444 RepID=A0A9Q0AVL1_9PEZI|nr:hypothetical protein JX265_001126 [Neoarthrinium moseri]